MTDEFGAFNPFDEVEKEETTESKEDLEDLNDSVENVHQQEVERADQKKLEEIEDEYKELDEELLDIDDGEETMWMIKKVSVGIIKIIGVVAVIILILWSIWGGDSKEKIKEKPLNKEVEKVEVPKNTPKEKKITVVKNKTTPSDKKVIKQEKKEEVSFLNKLFGGTDKEEEIETEVVIPAVSENEKKEYTEYKAQKQEISLPHPATIQVMAWNYWLEKDRLLGQKNTPGEVALWTKDAEALFDIPFAEQVKGNSDTEREKRVDSLISSTEDILKKGEDIQNKLLVEITEFSAKEVQYRQEATEYERLFLEAMNKSDPTGIDEFLAEKIIAEKKQTENGIEMESRRILSEKVDSYAQVIINLREYLLANKKALVKDVQVVQFPEDPFNRIIPLEAWESLRNSAN